MNSAGSSSPAPARVTVIPSGVRYRWTTLAGVANQMGRIDGVGAAARFAYPSGITLGSDGTIFVADGGSLRRVTPEGVVSTVVGADAAPLQFSFPVDVAVDWDGRLLVLDQGTAISRIFEDGMVGKLTGGHWGIGVAPDGSLWRTTTSSPFTSVGSQVQSVAADGSLKTRASNLKEPVDVTFDASGNAYIAEAAGPTIRRLGMDGQLTLFAGVAGMSGPDDGPADKALFQHPNSVCFDGTGNLFVADEFANTIRRISPDGTVTTVGGAYGLNGSADGVGSAARFSSPRRVIATREGVLYVVDTGSHTLRKGEPIIATWPTLQARTVNGDIQVAWTPGDSLVWLEGADRPQGAPWAPLDPLSDRDMSRYLLKEAGAGQSGFFRLRSE